MASGGGSPGVSTNTSTKVLEDGTRLQSVWTQNEKRAIALLGSGLNSESVAKTLGVSGPAVSQWLSNPDFAGEVTALRYEALNKHNVRDNAYDKMEDKILKQLEDSLIMVQQPMQLAKLLQVVNGAKRRGQTSPDVITNQTTVVTLLMPTSITQKFTTNINNQVIVAGDQTLETINSNSLLNTTKQKAESLHNELPNYTQVTTIDPRDL